jgi:hypothetical protein
MSAGTSPDNVLRLKGFDVTFTGGGGGGDAKTPDGSWRSCSGGVPTVTMIETTNSQTGQRVYSPGLSTVSDLVFEGFITPTRKSLVAWCNEVFAGKEKRSDISRATKKQDGTPGPIDNWFSCLLTNYKFPTCDVRSADPAQEVVTVKAYRHEKQ